MSVMRITDEVLVWELPAPRRAIASAPLGGGIGERSWILNAQVSRDYERTDIDDHLRAIAAEQACVGEGVGMLTAVKVAGVTTATDDDVRAYATVGVTAPTWAADADDAISAYAPPGTINVVAFVPARLDDGALVNAVMTATEAKSQALLAAGVPGTGTASDALCIVCEPASGDGTIERFGGPRSRIGAPLARAVHAAVTAGLPGARP
jgi:adenosylcobinamide hydrolase